MKTILFYWSRGAEIRIRLVRLVGESERNNRPCYINLMAGKTRLSHVAVKKHVDLLVEEGYVRIVNPGGKPHYLVLEEKGKEILKEFGGKK